MRDGFKIYIRATHQSDCRRNPRALLRRGKRKRLPKGRPKSSISRRMDRRNSPTADLPVVFHDPFSNFETKRTPHWTYHRFKL